MLRMGARCQVMVPARRRERVVMASKYLIFHWRIARLCFQPLSIYGLCHIRQNNMNETVSIYRYVTQGSFDAYLWQALETKARFIAQVLTGDSTVRQAEDIGAQELSYAEVKAIASGNPAVLTLAEANAALQRLTVLQKHHADEQYLARRQLRALPADLTRLECRVAALRQDITTAEVHATAPVTIGTQPYSRPDALEALTARLQALPAMVYETRRVPLGQYRGLH